VLLGASAQGQNILPGQCVAHVAPQLGSATLWVGKLLNGRKI
jgi:hypothetical protein